MAKFEDLKDGVIFPIGKENKEYAAYFIGKSYLEWLVTNPLYNCPVAQVTFEPGCRNHWHAHAGGQILLVIGGIGWYQEEGKRPEKLVAGDVVTIAPNVVHWHGASKDSWFAHLAITTNPEAGGTTWFQPVTATAYNEL